MPANLTPEYRRAEQRYRAARTVDEKIAALEDMLRVMPKHKGTDHLQADVKARIATLRKESSKKEARSGFSYIIPREGAGQVALAGPPNAGKSSLVRSLTHATPAVGDYPFTTREPTPGMMAFEDIAFQLVDLPPLSEQHVEPWVFDLVRRADLVWVVASGLEALEIVRVYTKQPGKPPDRSAPFTLPRGATVAELAQRIHKDLLASMKFARVWGPRVFDGQAVQKDYVLAEGDIVEIHT